MTVVSCDNVTFGLTEKEQEEVIAWMCVVAVLLVAHAKCTVLLSGQVDESKLLL